MQFRSSTDPMYATPYVDVHEWRDEPVRHRYVHGGFEATDLRFSYYFPPEDRYEGRFFQPILAMSGTEHMFAGAAGFAVASGAYMVESNLGRLNPFPGDDSTVTGYRASAAAARYSRVVAAEMYGEHRPYGYCYGGSGGGYKTISCLESTQGVWDGGVPFVIGSPQSLPNVFSVQAHAMRVLWNTFPRIVDALDPGGSGDMYAGLSVEEREALAEVTRMGFPPRAWFDVRRIAQGYTGVWSVLGDNMQKYDPAYFEDFWTIPGYLGANPTESLLRARVQHKTTVVKPIMQSEARELGLPPAMAIARTESMADIPAALRVADLPDANLMGAMLTMTSGNAAGRNFWVVSVRGDIVITGLGEANLEGLAGVAAGDEVLIDNSVYLAFQTYHRHQVHPDYPEWDQFCVGGQPIYPQRPNLMGTRYARAGAGSVQSGRFAGKMIVIEALMDEAAYPWQAAHYHRLVEGVLGPQTDDRFRLWFVDHAMHTAPGRSTRTVSYDGVVQQALRSLAAWVEKGVLPPASNAYRVVDGQVILPAKASDRLGVQPTVEVTANGSARADVKAGDTVEFSAFIEMPPSAGTIVAVKWDFDGTGAYAVAEPDVDGSASRLLVSATHTFTHPGTYFPAVRVSSHSRGDLNERHARAHNLGRVRVVVE